jgi:hypothetical protein
MCLALFISIHYANKSKAPTLMYFVWMFTINIKYKTKIPQNKGTFNKYIYKTGYR